MGRRLSLAVAALGLAVAVGITDPATAQTPVEVVMVSEFAFAPTELTVPAGLTMFTLNNTDSRRHDMVIAYNETTLQSETLGGGEVGMWEVTLDQAGTYEFWCSVGNHRERGMTGWLTVQ